MKISLISASHRENSQSTRVMNILSKNLSDKKNVVETFCFDFYTENPPLWSGDKKNKKGFWGEKWPHISANLNSSDGFIFIVPEYGGMAAPNAKNFFLICGEGELAHKPGLLVSVSSGNGGAYPISELRSSSYKNTHITWIPENIIIRNVEHYNPGYHGNLIPEWLDNRIDYSIELLLAYAKHMKPIREIVNRKDFGNGM